MQKKTISIFIVIFAVLLTIAAYPQWKKYAGVKEEVNVPAEIDFSKFSEDRVGRISIKEPENDEIKLEKTDGLWKVNGFEASADEIKSFFENLKNAKFKSLASKNKTNHGAYDIGDDKGITLAIADESGEKTYIIGKSGPDYSSFYVRTKDGADVYLFSGSLRNNLIKKAEDWKKKEEKKTEEAE